LIKKFIKKKGRAQHLPDSCLQTCRGRPSTADENSSYIHFHRDLNAPVMSTDMSQLGVALFPSF